MKTLCIPVGLIQANCYLVGDDQGKACIIDPGAEAERLAAVLIQNGLELTHILLTHGHLDHLGGAAVLAKVLGTPLCCSRYTADMVRDPGRHSIFSSARGIPGYDPDIMLAEGDTLEVGALRVNVIETPGHTPGDLTFEIEGELFCGDLIFYRSVGRTDFPGGDFDALLASVQKLVDRYPPSTVVHPGHMQDTTLAAEIAYNPFLRGLVPRG